MPAVPAGFFGIVLGLAGLGSTWRAAHQAWQLPAVVGESILLLAAIVWAVLAVLYTMKWLYARDAALAEAAHPVQCCFIGLAGVATMLIAAAAVPYSRPVAMGLFLLGSMFTLAFAVWRTGGLWHGDREPTSTTPVLYLPTVAGTFVAGTVAAALGYRDWGQMAFGAGLFSWLAIESVLLARMFNAPGMAKALRPTLGIQLAPPVVGAVTLLSVAPEGLPVFFVQAMLGYGLLQCLILLRLLPWIMQEPFAPSYWAFTFGATALATAPIRLLVQGSDGPVTVLAPILFVFANVVVGLVAVATVHRAAQGRLFGPPAAAAPDKANAA
ncbi:dicarboxylate transporter/tellurite-resistance protein TehA [Bordetella flabilis]|uniref:Dicarboxylate transporter/tellurite-resistance protein TehA n=2 Tax=Bordetella flabilis TaxID=463014 RepID=A0A193GBX7_9BORD|nr:dicarboxylate transporter/tellurite-resistance protein TehA [Bordetella flabilis]